MGQHGFVASHLEISGNYVRSTKTEVLKPTVLNSRVYRVQLVFPVGFWSLDMLAPRCALYL